MMFLDVIGFIFSLSVFFVFCVLVLCFSAVSVIAFMFVPAQT